jgi:hypothetical protein
MNRTQAQSVFADTTRWEAAKAKTLALRTELDRKLTADDVHANKWLALVAEQYARTYRGDFEYMLSQRDFVCSGKFQSYRQVAGTINCAVADWRRAAPVSHPSEQFTLPNVADVPSSRYRVVAADGTSLSVRLDNASWAKDKPEGTRALYYLGRDAQWQFSAFVRPSGQVDLLRREQKMAPRLKSVLGDLAGSVREGRWLVHALAFSMEGSVCCFCGRDLDTAESISVGYGPTCAANHGLPWGAMAEPASIMLARDAMKNGGIDTAADDWEGKPLPEFSETNDEHRAEMEAQAHLDVPRPIVQDDDWKGHQTGQFESGRAILSKAGISLDERYGKSSYRPGRSYADIFGAD